MTRVVVIGAGIGGLSVAHALRAAVPEAEILVLEKSDRVGGHIRSERAEGYLCEWGPDGFLDNAPATLDLVRQLGLESRVLRSCDAARRRFIFRHGALHELPMGPGAFVRSGLLSMRGKLRIALEPLAARRPAHDESIHHFAERRIGREAAEVMIGSMVSGIFAGDAQQLSLRACFPKMWDLETEYGSLFRALFAKMRVRRPENGLGAPAGTLTSFIDGMEELPRTLAATLGTIVRTNSPVATLRKRDAIGSGGPRPVGGARVHRSERHPRDRSGCRRPRGPGDAERRPDPTVRFDARGVAVHRAHGADRRRVPGIRRRSACRGPRRAHRIRVSGAAERGRPHPGRAVGVIDLHTSRTRRQGVRPCNGGRRRRIPDAASLDDAELLSLVTADLRRTMKLRISPEFVRIIRHHRGIPQYTIGHLSRMTRIEGLLKAHTGLFLAGNSYRGVAVNACVADAPVVAERVADYLRTVETAGGYTVAR